LTNHSGVSRCNRPSRITTVRVGRRSSRHQVTSVWSPNVQHIAMPAPLSFSAARCASTGISTPNSGEVTVVPNRFWYRSSSGWAISAHTLTSSSGRVVSM